MEPGGRLAVRHQCERGRKVLTKPKRSSAEAKQRRTFGVIPPPKLYRAGADARGNSSIAPWPPLDAFRDWSRSTSASGTTPGSLR
jgi:hypothetical protein